MTAITKIFTMFGLAFAVAAPWPCHAWSPEMKIGGNIVGAAQATTSLSGFSGSAVSGNVDYSKLPSKARKFLERYCDGHAVVQCEKVYEQGCFNLRLADGIRMSFDSKGGIMSISAPDNYSLSPYLLKAVLPGKLYNLLENNGFRESVEAVREEEHRYYRLAIADPVIHEICFDRSGILTLITER